MSGGGRPLLGGDRTGLVGIDPRIRLLSATVFAFVAVSLEAIPALVAAVLIGAAGVVVARVPAAAVFHRLLALDALMLLVVATLPFAMPGETLLQWGGVVASREGLVRAVEILAKANAVVLMLLALLHGVPAPTLAHALQRLGLPDRLVHLLFFTVRYLDVLGGEYVRLRRAMTARAFRPRTDRHTWRSLGWLVGMLLVRSFERAERVLAAMKCRGFDGRLHSFADLRMRAIDGAFAVAGCGVLAGLLWLEAR
ncbi:MAG: cobalt ECF transporter T component CbiQ [Rhodospirillales bacterium]|nr:cobalt ECF transporter T component CbiQ [Rhodospirillales bacterium]